MMCDIMPTLSEDGDMMGEGSIEDNNFEQLMVNMLDERDKLMETLRETQDNLSSVKITLKETELERDTLIREFDLVLGKCELDRNQLLRKLTSFDAKDDEDTVITRLKQLKSPLSEEFVGLAKEVFQLKEKLNERNEEIAELKAERSNTKLLLEHLESLVSRHERSLRMTVVKRQAQSSAGVSSEVEVLKALKSLFEHHKALDEKVRERLRMAVEKANNLEEDLATANLEIEHLQYEVKLAREGRTHSMQSDSTSVSNGPIDERNEDLQEEVSRLRYNLEQKQKEVEKHRKEAKDANDRFSNLEEQVQQTNTKASNSYESNKKIQRQLDERKKKLNNSVKFGDKAKLKALSQRTDAEQRIKALEKRFVRSQNELSTYAEEGEKIKAEMMSLRTLLEQRDEKINNLQEQCKFYEMKCSQTIKTAEQLPRIQEELENRKAALNAAEERNFTVEEQLQNLQAQVEELSADLSKAREREKITENHNLKLQSTIDKLLAESNERLQKHLKERMQNLDEKTILSQELDKLRSEGEELKREKGQFSSEVEKLKSEISLYKKQIQLNSSSKPVTPTFSSSISPQVNQVNSKASSESSWQTMSQANVVSSVSKVFPNAEDVDGNTSFTKITTSSPAVTPVPAIITDDNLETLNSKDAQKLANVLQQQLDAINEELALLQVEHRTTERLTEQIQKRVSSETNSLDNMSVGSSKSDKTERKVNVAEQPLNLSKPMIRQDSDEINFLLSSHDPLDTKPMMLKAGRSQEQLHEAEIDTPSSQPSDSTESEGSEKSKLSIPWNLSTSYESDKDSYFEYQSATSSLGTSMESLSRRAKNRGLKNSLGKIFSAKGKLKPREFGHTNRIDELETNAETQKDVETRMKRKLLEDVIASGSPFATWNAPTILAWLELWVKLPEWYIQACRANVKSGSIMSGLSDYEIQHEIGVNNPLHRLKLRLAIHEIINVTSPISPPSTRTSLVYGDMNHFWIASEWLATLGLPQYRYSFIENLVDARMLEHITKKEYTKYLKVVDGFHRTSLSCGTKCLQFLNYDRKVLEKRKKEAENENKDVLVWSNARIIKWISDIGLDDFTDYLRQSGIHGAVFVFDETFDADIFAYYLQIPNSNEAKRALLEREYNKLITTCNELRSSPAQSDLGDGDFKRAKSWRKKFKKERTSLKRKEDLQRKHSGESDAQTASSGSGEITSPLRRPRKSPLTERKLYTFRGGPT